MHIHSDNRFGKTRAGRFKLAAAVIAAALLLPLAPLAAPAAAQDDTSDRIAALEVVRVSGQDRYETSIEVAWQYHDRAKPPLTTVVMTSGVHWTDSVVAAGIAGRLGAPMLLTSPYRLRADTLDALTRFKTERVVLVSAEPPGQSPTVGTAVSDSLEAAGISVERVSGADQYRTGVAAARRLGGAGELGSFGATAVIASGEVFADALVAGPLAVHSHLPVLLTPKAGLHPHVGQYLTDAGIRHAVLMGGEAALSSNVETSIEALGITVDRIAGSDRFDTAVRFAEYAAEHTDACFDGEQIGLARARVPFDSLGAAPLLAQRCAPLVLTDPNSMPGHTTGFIDDSRDGRHRVTLFVFGGNAAVSQRLLDGYLHGNPATAAKYKNRSPGSLLPATDRYFIDHDEVASLFPLCNPAPDHNKDTLSKHRDLMDRLQGFDTQITPAPFGSTTINFTTGWWTQDQLEYFYGRTYPEITPEWAAENITMWSWNQIGFGDRPVYYPPSWRIGPSPTAKALSGLYKRIAYSGYVRGDPQGKVAFEYVNHLGIDPAVRVDIDNDEVWPADGGQLLWDWTGYMVQFPPVDREPGAWGMHTLITTRHASCVARTVLARCDEPFTDDTSPHLRNDSKASPLGLAMWNLVCGKWPGQ